MTTQFRTLPVFGGDARAVAEIVNGAMNGKTNNTGTVTLATGNATTTTIYDKRISVDSKIIVIPWSAAAFYDSLPYGQFSKDDDQMAPSAGSSAVVTFTDTDYSAGVYLSSSSRIYVRNAGTYNIQFSMQLVNYANSLEYADVWFRVNGSDLANSASRFDLPIRKSSGVPSHIIGTVNTFATMNAGDYIELAGAVSSTDVKLESYSADAGIPRPAIPAVILTVNYVNCSASTNVYVSSQTQGEATLTHFSNDTSDKTYAYVVIG
jgi:hypothetical protein